LLQIAMDFCTPLSTLYLVLCTSSCIDMTSSYNADGNKLICRCFSLLYPYRFTDYLLSPNSYPTSSCFCHQQRSWSCIL